MHTMPHCSIVAFAASVGPNMIDAGVKISAICWVSDGR